LALVVTAVLAGSTAAMAQSAKHATASPPTAPMPSVAGGLSTVARSPSQQLARALREIHMTTCAPLAQTAADFLFENGAANFTVQPLGPNADQWPTVIVIESAHADQGRTRFSTITVAPGPGGCSGLYEQVIHWTQSCPVLKATTFADFQSERLMLRDVRVSEANPGLQLYLTPAGTGCVSVKKELLR
jgi:hypothetical protein